MQCQPAAAPPTLSVESDEPFQNFIPMALRTRHFSSEKRTSPPHALIDLSTKESGKRDFGMDRLAAPAARAVEAVRHAPLGASQHLKIGRVPLTGVREGNALEFRAQRADMRRDGGSAR